MVRESQSTSRGPLPSAWRTHIASADGPRAALACACCAKALKRSFTLPSGGDTLVASSATPVHRRRSSAPPSPSRCCLHARGEPDDSSGAAAAASPPSEAAGLLRAAFFERVARLPATRFGSPAAASIMLGAMFSCAERCGTRRRE